VLNDEKAELIETINVTAVRKNGITNTCVISWFYSVRYVFTIQRFNLRVYIT